MKLFSLVFAVFMASSCATQTGGDKSAEVPVSVDRIESHRVGENLVRIIVHNMELLPQIDIELLATPEVHSIQAVSIEQIEVDGEVLNFAQSSGAYVESTSVDKDSIMFELEYFYLDGGSDIILCNVLVSATEIGEPNCLKK